MSGQIIGYLAGLVDGGPPRDDPAAFFAGLAAHAPAVRVDATLALVAAADQVKATLSDPRLGTGLGAGPRSAVTGVPELAAVFRGLLSLHDGGTHARLRHVIAPHFNARSAEAIRADVVAAITRLWPADGRTFDVAGGFAAVLPVAIARVLMRLPPSDEPALLRWAHLIRDQIGRFDQPAAERAEVAAALRAVRAYAGAVLGSASSGVLGSVAAAVESGAIDDDEAFGLFVLLLINGLETLSNAVVHTVRAVGADPGLLARVLAEPAAAHQVYREVLLDRPPLPLLARRADCPAHVAGGELPAGATVLVVLAAAMRDPAGRVAPELAYGYGPHVCLGMHLADIAGAELLRFLAARYQRVTPVGEALPSRAPLVDGYLRFDVCTRPLAGAR